MSNRLVEYQLERLKSKNPEIRLKSIAELRLLADPLALEALEQVYRTDPEADVRKAAQEAGYEIFVKNKPKKTE